MDVIMLFTRWSHVPFHSHKILDDFVAASARILYSGMYAVMYARVRMRLILSLSVFGEELVKDHNAR